MAELPPETIEALRVAGRYWGGRQRREPRTCETCGKTFKGQRRAKYCSLKCRVAGFRRRQRETNAPAD